MPEPRHLRVIDGNGELDESAAVLPGDYATLEETNRKLRRQVADLKRKIANMHEVSPEAETISSIMEYWRTKTGHEKAKITLTGVRAAKVRKRLEDGYKPEELRRAIDGCAAMPYLGAYGVRYCCDGEGRKLKDDLSYILRDEAQVEAFMKLADGDAAHKAYRAYVHGLCRSSPSVLVALAQLGDREPHGEVLRKAALWARREMAS